MNNIMFIIRAGCGTCHTASTFMPHSRTPTATICSTSSLLLLGFTLSRSFHFYCCKRLLGRNNTATASAPHEKCQHLHRLATVAHLFPWFSTLARVSLILPLYHGFWTQNAHCGLIFLVAQCSLQTCSKVHTRNSNSLLSCLWHKCPAQLSSTLPRCHHILCLISFLPSP